MKSNPALKRLGLSDTDRAVVIHTDDIGMCQASVSAFMELWEFGLISSGSVMVPCPWFPAVAKFCREHPLVDMGVHITLNSEWETYRWGAVSTCEALSGLLDDTGYLHQAQPAVFDQADPEAVQTEILAQVQKSLKAGIQITHIDTHMGTVAYSKFINAYVQTAIQHHVPAMILRMDEKGYMQTGLDVESARIAVEKVAVLEEMGLPLIDHISGITVTQPEECEEKAKEALAKLPAGITHFIIHPSKDTPELREIMPAWAFRVAEYQAFCGEELRKFIRNSGIQVIGYRDLKSLMPS